MRLLQMQPSNMTFLHRKMKKCRFTNLATLCILYTVILHILLFLSILKSLLMAARFSSCSHRPIPPHDILFTVEKLHDEKTDSNAVRFLCANYDKTIIY